MLTTEQTIWLNYLNDSNSTKVIPYDARVKIVFKKIKSNLIEILGNVPILHRGSSALEIAGQGEIDLYIPITTKDFNIYLNILKSHLGEPGSVYDLRRARFVKYIDDIKIEIFIINKNSADWKNSVKFERYLKDHPHALKAYEQLKLANAGRSTRVYYTKKLEFINKILDKI